MSRDGSVHLDDLGYIFAFFISPNFVYLSSVSQATYYSFNKFVFCLISQSRFQVFVSKKKHVYYFSSSGSNFLNCRWTLNTNDFNWYTYLIIFWNTYTFLFNFILRILLWNNWKQFLSTRWYKNKLWLETLNDLPRTSGIEKSLEAKSLPSQYHISPYLFTLLYIMSVPVRVLNQK